MTPPPGYASMLLFGLLPAALAGALLVIVGFRWCARTSFPPSRTGEMLIAWGCQTIALPVVVGSWLALAFLLPDWAESLYGWLMQPGWRGWSVGIAYYLLAVHVGGIASWLLRRRARLRFVGVF